MSDTAVTTPEPAWAAFVALDWGSHKHASIRQPAGGGKRDEGYVDHTPEAIAVWASDLNCRFGGQPIAVALEQKRGSVVNFLLPYTLLVLFPVPAFMSSSYRKTLVPSGAKDDPGDAAGLWTCSHGTATVFVASIPRTPTPTRCSCWSKTAASSMMTKPAWRYAYKTA